MSHKIETYTIDRIEENKIVLEDEKRQIILINTEDIIGNFTEGDIVNKKNNKYYIDIEETRRRKNKINNLVKGLWAE